MELVYLWVEKYKNIRNQGFRFSPRFECEFDGKNLTITKKEDYVNIFPENIDVTAIAGENGSGKSSIYELLFNLIHYVDIQNPNSFNFIVTYDKKENKYFIDNKNNLGININGEKNQCNINTNDNYLLLLDLVYSPWTIVNSRNKITYKESYALEPSRILSNSSLANKMDINGFYSNLKSFGFYGYMFLKNINIKSDFFKKLEKLESVKIEKRGDDELTRLEEFMILITLNQGISKEINSHFRIKTDDINIKNIKHIYNKYEKYKQPLNTNKNIRESFKSFLKHHRIYKFGLTKYLDIFDKIITCTKNKAEITRIYKNFENLHLLFSLYNFEMNFEDKSDFKSLSSGQTTLLLYIGYIAKYIKYCQNSNKKSCTIIIDECETSLHPNWQKQTVKFFLDSVKNEILKNLKINLIFISHSPFILSDIPKENVIFLEKYHEKDKDILKVKYPTLNIKDLKDGDCINVSEHIKLKTFGANIHTLLSHGFFMRDGLMGEFAKSKITEILEFLNDKEELKTIKKEQIKPIIESIGEDFLRNKLLNLYHKKLTENEKETEKGILENKIEELKRQLKELK